MTLEQEALDFVSCLQTLYLEKRDMKTLVCAMMERTSWIGTGEQEICDCLKDAKQALSGEIKEYGGEFSITDQNLKTVSIGNEICIVYGRVSAHAQDDEIADIHNRISAVCIKTDQGMKLLHLHISHPYEGQELNRFFVKKKNIYDKRILQAVIEQTQLEIKKRNGELEALMINIPAGVIQYKEDEYLTLLSVSNGFLSMFGYTREEVQEYFEDKFINMIYTGDRISVIEAIKNQLKQGEMFEVEFGIICKDGRSIWVLNKGRLLKSDSGIQTCFCVLIDMTERKKVQEELRLSLEQHKLIMNQATDIIFEWDIANDTLMVSSNWKRKFGYKAISRNVSIGIQKSLNIFPEDMPLFLDLMRNIMDGNPFSEAELRIKNIDGVFRWYCIRATTQYDDYSRPIKAVGVITDIDSDKNQRQVLLERAQNDALTGLLNKLAVKEKIEEYFSNQSAKSGTMFIIDLDNFKLINDLFGHLCGDAVISDMAGSLKELINNEGTIGRIGGDEFLVYLPGILEAEATKKAEIVLDTIGKIHLEGFNEKLKASIGIAFYPSQAQEFNGLFFCADRALYHVKNHGKGGYSFYHSWMNEDSITKDMIKNGIESMIDITEMDSNNNELAQYSFEMLYSSVDINLAVNKLLEIIGMAYHVSRVYIFENSEDDWFCSNTFEWCNEGILSEKNRRQCLSYQDVLYGYSDNFDENHVFYCYDIDALDVRLQEFLAPQKMVSTLQCAILEDGKFKGFVGYDECVKYRFWTKEQIKSLSKISNIISTFLLKKRLKEQVGALQQKLEERKR